MGNRCRLRTAICHASSKWCGYPGLRAHNPLTSPITQRSRRTYNCGVKQPPHYDLKHKLDMYVSYLPKVRLLRLPKSRGSSVSRQLGIDDAIFDIIVVMDSHFEVADGWYEPMAKRIMEDPSLLLVPVVDTINHATLQYFPSEIPNRHLDCTSFDFYLGQTRILMKEAYVDSLPKPIINPFKLAAFQGGYFMANKTVFQRLGGFDRGFGTWGGEQMELSFKYWMCAGGLELIPCSRAGHVYRTKVVWHDHIANETILNEYRVAEVWMDEYKHILFERAGNYTFKIGDVSARHEVRRRNNCTSFQTYLDTISQFVHQYVPRDLKASGVGCFINHFIGKDSADVYTLGCDNQGLVCGESGSKPIIIGKRQIATQGQKSACCTTDLCNEDLSLLAMKTERCEDKNAVECRISVESTNSTTEQACYDLDLSEDCKLTCGLCESGIAGTSFYVDFAKMDGNANGHIELLMVSTTSGQVDVSIPYLNISTTLTISAGLTKYSISKNVIPVNLHKEKKGVEIHSTVPISMFAMNVEGFNTDGYAVIPIQKLGTEHFVPSTVGENEVTILSPYANNAVSITLKLRYGSIYYNGKRYTNNQVINVDLNYLETFEINSYSQIAGTKITSTKPVAVVSGDRCTHLEGVGCDHLLDMIPSTKYYSTDFIIPQLYERKNSTVQIITSNPGNTVDVYETAGAKSIKQTLRSAGDHADVVIPGLATISATQGVLVTMFVHACCAPVYHEPFMMIVPGVDRYLPEYNFAVWDDGHNFQNHITIIIPQTNTLGLILNNNTVTPPPTVYKVNLKGVTYSVFDVSVTPGAHHLMHDQGQKFGLFVHGNRFSNGYGYSAGMSYN
ncbi:hypothetical protein FSP39_010886 [Pinctada imbricata]|uniref:Uncharacterized protein n=1 Tax=Pinctada imbricata TaxID=66713 RepID=A0AA88Y3B0_PINIB|nr:hypothetical protein FSP39_010886 [Pinctada imbricata]